MSKEKKVKVKLENRMGFWERNRLSNGYLLRKTIVNYTISILRAILLFGMCFLIIQPLLNKISISFMAERDLYDATVISIPRHFTLDNYKLVAKLLNFKESLFNSAWVALLVAILQIISCTLVGYGFARYQFPLKNFWFGCVILSIVVPPQTFMSSQYLHFRFFDILGIFEATTGAPLNLLQTSAPYFMLVATCMGLRSGLYIFMIRQYFRGVPKELEEAAYVDGCGKIKTFLMIMLPDAKPILTSCFLFSLVWQWTDNYYSNLFMKKIALLTDSLSAIPMQLYDYLGVHPTIGYSNAMTSTGMLMVILPLLVLYLFAQKGFVESLSQTGIKM